MKCLVTGAAGFIGSHLVDRLLEEGHEVAGVDISADRRNVPASFDLIAADVASPEINDVVLRFAPDTIFHLGAQISVQRSVEDPVDDARVNVLGTLRVLTAAAEAGCAKVVFASSGGTIYGEPAPTDIPVGEDGFGGRPASPYGISKRVVEDYLRFFRTVKGLNFCSLALSNVYGPRQDPHGEAGVVAIFARTLLDGRACTVFGDGEQTRDFVFVEDVSHAFVLAATKGDGETINIGTGVETSVNRLYEAMAPLCERDGPAQYGPARSGEMRRIALDSSRAEGALGWRPAVSMLEGLKKTVDWFSTQPGSSGGAKVGL